VISSGGPIPLISTARTRLARLDRLLITRTDAEGETVAYLEVQMERLPADE
jgi:hypothetical protein